MKLIKPNYEILPKGKDLLKGIELAARTCYKSEDKITVSNDSAVKLVTNLVNRKHDAMLEFGDNIIMEVCNDNYDKILEYCDIKYLNVTCRLAGVNIISGSVRAIRDALKTNVETEYILEALGCRIEGFSLISGLSNEIVDDLRSYELKIISESDLTSEELFIHGTLTVKFLADRGFTHELVRQRPASFAQESTRFCNYTKNKDLQFIAPNWIDEDQLELVQRMNEQTYFKLDKNVITWYSSMLHAEQSYNQLIKKGWTTHQARSVLPNSLKTEIIMKSTYSHWHHVFTQRVATAAHEQMRELMRPLLNKVKTTVPGFFNDITY